MPRHSNTIKTSLLPAPTPIKKWKKTEKRRKSMNIFGGYDTTVV
jgi:hypothetical protein